MISVGSVKRYHEDKALYFITTTTEGRKEIFKDSIACELLVNILIYNKFIYDFSVYGFVIMPDHFHIIIQPNGELNISEIMKKVKGNFSRFYNKITGLKGGIWQQGFYDEGIRDEVQLREVIKYIHANPFKKGLVSDVREYKYSSYQYYEMENGSFRLLIDSIQ